MNTLHRLAGVQEASDITQPPAPVASNNNNLPPPPVPKDNPNESNTDNLRRASLPLNRQPSHKSFRSLNSRKSTTLSRPQSRHHDARADYPPTPRLQQRFGEEDAPRASYDSHRASEEAAAADDNDDEEEEYTWGPSHPCFPHPNPHCAPNSAEAAATRVIRVRRDWLASGDVYPQYANLYPEILDPLVADGEFRELVQTLNELLARAFSPFTTRAWVDSLLGAATGYLWEDLGLAGAKSGEKELERFVSDWNFVRERGGKEVRLVQLRTTGFMSLDFVVPDPGIDVAREGDDAEAEEVENGGADGQEIREALGGNDYVETG